MGCYFFYIPETIKENMRKDPTINQGDLFKNSYIRAVCFSCLSIVSFTPSEVPIYSGRIHVKHSYSYDRIPAFKIARLENFMCMDFVKGKLVKIKPESIVNYDDGMLHIIDSGLPLPRKILPRYGMTPKFSKDLNYKGNSHVYFKLTLPKIRSVITRYRDDLTPQKVNLTTADTWIMAKFYRKHLCHERGHTVFNTNQDRERRCRRCNFFYSQNASDQMIRCRQLSDPFRFGQHEQIFVY